MIKTNLNILICFIILVFPNYNRAEEILIYADKISYDEQENIIARGNAKIFNKNQFIISDLIIFDKKKNKIILPSTFTLKDSNNNYLSGSNGFFEQSLDYGEFEDIKIKLNDGSRIIGKKGRREGNIDIISKGVYTPCKSRIKIANFICPTWQLEAEKILHDNEKLFLYQKHSKMRVINTPVFYIPYIVTPSPLRKNRKSGFLSPGISLNFFDTKTSQSLSFPYYFNLDVDKELTFTPMVNYGGGVDSSQRFIFDYNQILSGGNFSSDLTFDSNFERQNNNKWLRDASLITEYNQKINKNYKVSFDSALQTSQNYIQITKPNDDLSYESSLSTNFLLEGFNLKKIDDYLQTNVNFYQTNQENENNKKTPTVLPNIKYYSGSEKILDYNTYGMYQFYNIFRDEPTSIHSKSQQKISHTFNTSKNLIRYNSKFTLRTEIYNQLFNTHKKLVDTNQYHSGSIYRFFPIVGIKAETPFKFKNSLKNFTINPKAQLILTPGASNSNKISNEDSSNNNFSIENFSSLNRFSGSDRVDNSKRLEYGLNIHSNKINLNFSQYYEFTENSNFHKEEGNDDYLSDLLGTIEYKNVNSLKYNMRYDFNDNFLKEQNLNLFYKNKYGEFSTSYLDQKSKTNNIILQDTETINYKYLSKKFKKFSKIQVSGLYDMKKEINTEYSIGYSYFDECFGINIDFNRKSYKEDTLTPQDILTLMFSFKNIGSYKSTNLTRSKESKEDISWENINLNNNLFADYE